jgi:hypothetical protein
MGFNSGLKGLNYRRGHFYYGLLETNRKISFLIIAWV